MNSLATLNRNAPASVVVSPATMDLMQASKSANTLRSYKYALIRLDDWLGGQQLNDEMLAEYITERHEAGKAPTMPAHNAGAELELTNMDRRWLTSNV